MKQNNTYFRILNLLEDNSVKIIGPKRRQSSALKITTAIPHDSNSSLCFCSSQNENANKAEKENLKKLKFFFVKY